MTTSPIAWTLLAGLTGLPVLGAEPVTPSAPLDDELIAFTSHPLQGLALDRPTSLDFGPDGVLYVAEQTGRILAVTVTVSAEGYHASSVQEIDLVRSIPNHDDDGKPNPNVIGRQVTGLLAAGSAAWPVLYVASSDPRSGGGPTGLDVDLDTNSGIVSRLARGPAGWTREDLVRGLPRSEEHHGPNGLQLDPTTNTLYLAIGGHTNMGAPSTRFAGTPEYALSAAILAIDLDAIGTSTYDLPTLDDEERWGSPDENDPFGGNDGKNQAIIVPGGPVRVHSPGWRNAYDLVLTRNRRMYAVDNGPNADWGGLPADVTGACGNVPAEGGLTLGDALHLVLGPGFYAGHPNPTRASRENTFNVTDPQSPITSANPVECEYRIPGEGDGALFTWDHSTNGITEYTAGAFGGALRGNLLVAGFDGNIRRLALNAAGDTVLHEEVLFASGGVMPLDVTTQGDGEAFAGTVWVINRISGTVVAFRPAGSPGRAPELTGRGAQGGQGGQGGQDG